MQPKNIVTAVVVVLLAVVAIAAAYMIFDSSREPASAQILFPSPTPVPTVIRKAHIAGAVQNPGVYVFQDGDRLEDGIALAGGASEDADLSRVNLSVRLRDEALYWIPFEGDDMPPATAQNLADPGSTGTLSATPSKIDLNTATFEQLDTLPNVGEVRARAILAHREANGPFASIEQLTEVQGIGVGILEGIREMIEVR
jgi:competence protein ComEA